MTFGTGAEQEIFLAGDGGRPPLEALTTGNLTADDLPPGVPDAAANPLVVYAIVAAAVVWVAANAIARVADPISQVLTKRREHRQRSEDARILDLSGQVDHLAGRVFTLESRQTRQDAYLYQHAVWDQQVLDACIRAGIALDDLGAPPPLRPPIDAP